MFVKMSVLPSVLWDISQKMSEVMGSLYDIEGE